MAKKDLILIVGVDDKGTPVIKGMARQVGGELQKLDQKARKTGKGFNKLKDDVDKSASGMSKFKSILKSTAIQMAAGMGVMMSVQAVVRGIKNAVTDFIKTGREFEKSWANVTTMLSISEKATLKMKNQLIGLSPTLGSVTEMAKGMYQVLSASVEPAKAIIFLGTAAKAAVAGVTDVFTAVDALTTVINAYGMAAEDATMVSDIMFQTVKRGKLTFGELSSALGTVVPTAAQLGIRFEEIAAGMATLTRQGINVNTVTMQLRQVMMSVLKPTSEAKILAKDLGIEFTATALKAKGLSKFLEEITEKTGGNVTIMGEFFSNIRALSAVFGLAGKSAAEFAYDISLMENSMGSTEIAFQKQMKTLDFWIKTASHALEDMKVAFYEGMVDPIREAISSQEDLDKVFESMTKTAGMAGKTVGILSKIMGIFQPVLDEQLDKIANIEIEFAKFVNFISLGYIPALDNLAKKTVNTWIETDRLSKSEKELTSNMKGIWGTLSRGAILWKQQVEYYINSGMAADEYLEKLHKLWKGKTQFQKQSQELAAMDALDLQMKKELTNELAVLQGNIEVVIKSELAYTKTLENHVKKAMLLAEITGEVLSPAVRKLAEELDLYKKKSEGIQTVEDLNLRTKAQLGKELKTLTGVIQEAATSGDYYDSQLRKHVQSTIKLSEVTGETLSPEIVALAKSFGIATNKMLQAGIQARMLATGFTHMTSMAREAKEALKFLEKYAITMPPPDTSTWMPYWDWMNMKVQEYGQLVGMVTSAADGMFNQMYQNQMQRIDNEYQARKAAIDASMDSDQAKYFAIEKLDREMEKQRLAAQRKHAKAAKATSLLGAIVNTAEAITASLKVGGILGIALAAIVGAMGAAQVALIAAQPLPSFAKGGIAGLHGPEVIMVGEEGPERITPIRDERPPVMVSAGAGGGSRTVLFEANYNITAIDSLGVRDFVREKSGPEFIAWVRLNKTELLEALDMA